MTRRAPAERNGTGSRTAALCRQSLLVRFVRDTSGATVVEYGLVAGLTFLAIAGALRYYAERMEVMYQLIGAAVTKST